MTTSVDSPADRLVTLPEGLPALTLGWEVVRWATKYLKQPNGPRAGQRFEFTDSQIRFLLWFYAVNDSGEWLFHHAVRRLAKGSGKSPFAALWALAELTAPVRLKDFDPKAPGGCVGRPVEMPWVQIVATAESQPLALDTPVPTPSGFTTVGDLRPGDEVFGSDGRPAEVARVTPVYVGQECYRVCFDDGEVVVVSANHGWTVSRANSHDRKRELVTVSTEQMASDYLQNGGGARYTMPVVGVEFPKAEGLLVDPYFLGLWLGDGATADSSIAFDTAYEADVLRLVQEAIEPYDVLVVRHGPGRQGTVRVKRAARLCRWGHDWSNDERMNGRHVQCVQCLRERGKAKQGEPLLTMRERLRDIGVLGDKHIPVRYLRSHHEQRLALLQGLIDSDGHIDSKGRASFANRNHRLFEEVRQLTVSLGFKTTVLDDPSGAKRLFFNPKDGRVVARLPYKVARHRATESGSSKERRIRLVERVKSVPVRCIGIDTPDHLFLVGHNNTLTHNTKNTMRMVRAFAPKGSRLVHEFALDPGKTQYFKAPEGTLEQITSSYTAAEGAEATAIVGDELEHWKPSNGGVELSATLADNLAKSGSRMLGTCNSWIPGAGSVAETDWDAWVAQEEGRVRSESRILYDARMAPPDTDMTSEESLRRGLQMVYDDCWWVNPQAIITRIWDPRSKPDDSKRKYFNWPTAAEDAWLTPQEWSSIADPTQVVADGEEIVAFFDGSKSRDATALIGCRVSDGHVFTVGVWEPDTAHDADSVVPVGEVDAAVEQMFDRWKVLAFFADVKEWEGFVKVTWPERYRDQLLISAVPTGKDPQPIAWDMRSHVFDFTQACELTETEIADRRFTHDGDSRVARHVGNARRRPNRYGLSIGKESPDSPKKVDAAVCVIGVRMVRRLLMASPTWEKRTTTKARTRRVYGFN